MPKADVSTEELMELYKDIRSTRGVALHLKRERGIRIGRSTIQDRLKAVNPNYALADSCRVQKNDNSTAYAEEFEHRYDAGHSQTRRSLPLAAGLVTAPDKQRRLLNGHRYVFTAAQNNTYVHENFLAALLHFCEDREATLVVSQFTYNQSGFQNLTKEDGSKELWYDHRLKEYFINESCQITPSLVFCGELDILPTADLPLSGFGNYTQNASAIIPHCKVQMQSMARMKGNEPRFLYSTGAITLRNYIARKCGQKAAFHHVFGALYVEVDDNGDWFARQLIADESGRFYDLTDEYTADGVKHDVPVAAINWGDIHIEKMDQEIMYGAFKGKGCMLDTLKPGVQLIHDLTDFRARNHHNRKDPYFLAEMQAAGTDNVMDDIAKSAAFLCLISNRPATPDTKTVVVESNHDMAFKKWLREGDVSTDPVNCRTWHYYNAKIYEDILKNAKQSLNIYEVALKDSLVYHFQQKFPGVPVEARYNLDNIVFLREGDSYVICGNAGQSGTGGIECGLHGHNGPNGAKGNPRALRTIGRKVNIGHTHSACIIDGVYVSGVSGLLDMGYNAGPSSWSHSHIVTYQNGKRSIVTMRGTKWKA